MDVKDWLKNKPLQRNIMQIFKTDIKILPLNEQHYEAISWELTIGKCHTIQFDDTCACKADTQKIASKWYCIDVTVYGPPEPINGGVGPPESRLPSHRAIRTSYKIQHDMQDNIGKKEKNIKTSYTHLIMANCSMGQIKILWVKIRSKFTVLGWVMSG